jgi:TonB family protein
MPVAPAYSPRVDYGTSQRTLVTWTPGAVECEGGAAVAGQPVRRPLNTLGWPTTVDRPAAKVTITFDIDASGRPVSIRTKTSPVLNADVVPALAASRFPATARQGCTVTYLSQAQPLATAPVADLISYSVSPMSGALPMQGWARIRSAGNCSDKPRQQPLVRAFPDFTKLPGTPGVRDWTLVSYDTDAGGKPVHVRTASSTGNATLDAQGVEALRKSRFTGGARTACAYPYWRAAAPLVAPAMPEKGAYQDGQPGTCPPQGAWTVAPRLRFPPAFARRKIEGWAILRYDVAPWGEIGNISVLEAQPAEDFGQQATQILRSAKAPPSAQGASGCVDRVKFVMPREDAQADGKDGDGDDNASDEIPMIG